MKIEFPQRLAATGIIGLAALSASHWLRANVADPGAVLGFVLGVMPNLAAGFAMPLVLASFTSRISQVPVTEASRRAYTWVLAFTTFGLCGWELMQTRSERLVFDVNDLLATGLGAGLAYIAFGWHARREVKEHETAVRSEP